MEAKGFKTRKVILLDKVILFIYSINMQFSSSVTQKGQATIPAPIRKKLGLKPNDKVIFELKDNEVFVKSTTDFFSLKGSVKSKKPFNIEAMDRAVEDAIVNKYAKRSS